MSGEAADSTCPEQRLREVLLAYMQTCRMVCWPGADGLMLSDILGEYLSAAAAGQVPDEPELLRRFPDLASTVQAFLADPRRLAE